ncbi:hypothetical protein MADA3029_940019 [Vibrio nigripulchritudo MADA3029]|nr:hypothetical protein VIBNIMADA3020_910019 [Vibrio nigripulchritudo MADA3020]CCN52311.1 hypothetical protein VIBNIMADA3021_1230019 [Vibrio nigripulchritudo MADA3021]CCN62137.1 hypothetical protein MADA3029_940019 [Vibrio nigripulchritudo MADA3029]
MEPTQTEIWILKSPIKETLKLLLTAVNRLRKRIIFIEENLSESAEQCDAELFISHANKTKNADKYVSISSL